MTRKKRLGLVAGLAALMALIPSTAGAQVLPPSASNNSARITASIPIGPGASLDVQFRCAPGTVTGSTFTLTDPAPAFDTTTITLATPPGATTVPNVCSNSVNATLTQIAVTTTGSDGLTSVAPGGATTLTVTQSAAIPGSVFVTGYRLGLLPLGANTIPINVQSKIEGANTTQGVQTTNLVGGSPADGSLTVTTTISDPTPGDPGSGDESATDAAFNVTFTPLNWTAGSTGTILYRQDSIVPAAPPPPPTCATAPALCPPPAKKKCKKPKKLKKGKCVKPKKKKKKKKK